MSQIEVPDWVVEIALLASFRVACEHTGAAFSEDEFRNARDEHDRENRNVASDMMRAAITAALGAWVVPVGRLNDSSPTLYTLRQEKPE